MNLELFKNFISDKLPFTTSVHICCFNQEKRENIVIGFKQAITLEEAMTGREFWNFLK